MVKRKEIEREEDKDIKDPVWNEAREDLYREGEENWKLCSFCKKPLDLDYYHMYKFGISRKNLAKKNPNRKDEIEKLYRQQYNLCETCYIKIQKFVERQTKNN